MAEQKPFKSISAQCDPKTALDFNLSQAEDVKIGHILKFSFPNGGKDLVADMEIPNPMDPSSKIKVAGIFDFISWDGGPTDASNLDFRVSEKNRSILQQTLASATGGAEVEIEFVVYQYDTTNKKFFKYFHTNDAKCKYTISKGSQFSIAEKADREIEQPKNYTVNCSLSPKSEGDEQELHIAYDEGSPFVSRLGIAKAG